MILKANNRIALLNQGKVLKTGIKNDINKLIQTEINNEIEIIKNKKELIIELNQQEFIVDVEEYKDKFIDIFKNRTSYNNLLQILRKYDGLKVKEYGMSLEELFLKIIKQNVEND